VGQGFELLSELAFGVVTELLVSRDVYLLALFVVEHDYSFSYSISVVSQRMKLALVDAEAICSIPQKHTGNFLSRPMLQTRATRVIPRGGFTR
jgi:hypothetical protein